MNDILELFRIYGTIELKGADDADRQLDNIDRKAKGATGGVKGFVKGVGKVAAGIGIFTLVSKAIDTVKQSMDGAIARYDTLNNFPRVMQVLGFDAEDSEKAINKLSDGIQGLPTRLDEVARHAQNIATMTGDLDLATDTTLALNNAFLAAGSSTADASRGMEVYQNMLATGEVDAQRWKTLQETMGVALSMVAEKAGFEGPDAINKLREAIKDGEISFDEFNDMLIEVNEQQGGLADLAKENTDGLGTAWQNLQTWVVMGLTDVIGAIDEAMGGVGSISGAINKLRPVVMGVFGWIAEVAIPKVADGVRWARDRFDDLRDVFEQVKGALEPLFAVFRQTGENIKGQLVPFLETLYGVFQSLWPIIEKIGIIIGTSLLVTIIALTSILNGLYNAIIPIVTAFWNLVDVVINVVNAIIAVLTGDFQGALDFWNDAVESSVEFFKNLWDGIVGFVEGFVDAIVGWFEFLYDILVGNSIVPDMVDGILEWLGKLVEKAIEFAKELVNKVIDYFIELKDKAVERAKEMVNNVVESFGELKNKAIERVQQAVSGVVNKFVEMKNRATDRVNELLSTVRNKFNEVKQAMREKATEAVREVINKISELPGKIRQKATEFFNAGKRIVTSIADGIRSAISTVTGAISDVTSKVRNFLPFSPAKEGPLSDLDKLDFEGPIGDSIERGENTLRAKMAEMLGNVHPTANVNVGGRGVTTGTTGTSYTTLSQADSAVVSLLKELIKAVKENKDVYIDGDKVTGKVNENNAIMAIGGYMD